MGYNQYIGARYVPKIDGEWNNTKQYEPLIIVTHEGASFTSKKAVPIGIDILNTEYWVCTGNYNAQVELYRQETQNAVKTVNTKLDTFSNTQDGKFEALMTKYKTEINKYSDAKYEEINQDIQETNTNLTNVQNAINLKMTENEENLRTTTNNYKTEVEQQKAELQNILAVNYIILDEGTSTDIEDDSITIYDEGVI